MLYKLNTVLILYIRTIFSDRTSLKNKYTAHISEKKYLILTNRHVILNFFYNNVIVALILRTFQGESFPIRSKEIFRKFIQG